MDLNFWWSMMAIATGNLIDALMMTGHSVLGPRARTDDPVLAPCAHTLGCSPAGNRGSFRTGHQRDTFCTALVREDFAERSGQQLSGRWRCGGLNLCNIGELTPAPGAVVVCVTIRSRHTEPGPSDKKKPSAKTRGTPRPNPIRAHNTGTPSRLTPPRTGHARKQRKQRRTAGQGKKRKRKPPQNLDELPEEERQKVQASRTRAKHAKARLKAAKQGVPPPEGTEIRNRGPQRNLDELTEEERQRVIDSRERANRSYERKQAAERGLAPPKGTERRKPGPQGSAVPPGTERSGFFGPVSVQSYRGAEPGPGPSTLRHRRTQNERNARAGDQHHLTDTAGPGLNDPGVPPQPGPEHTPVQRRQPQITRPQPSHVDPLRAAAGEHEQPPLEPPPYAYPPPPERTRQPEQWLAAEQLLRLSQRSLPGTDEDELRPEINAHPRGHPSDQRDTAAQPGPAQPHSNTPDRNARRLAVEALLRHDPKQHEHTPSHDSGLDR